MGIMVRHSFLQDDLDGTPMAGTSPPIHRCSDPAYMSPPKVIYCAYVARAPGERAIEVLPVLDGLYLEDYQASGPEQKAIEPFIASRQYSDHPVTVHHWERPRPDD